MPMPHRTQQQLIKRRLVGKDGADRIRELRAILAELPGYRNGPYGDLRKWVERELEETRTRKRVVHRDSIAVRREGAAQIALVGEAAIRHRAQRVAEVERAGGARGKTDPDSHPASVRFCPRWSPGAQLCSAKTASPPLPTTAS